MNICVIGTGYVGLVTGSCFAEFGLNVTCVDNDGQKIALLQSGTSPIFEPGLEEMLKRNLKEGRLTFTTEIDKAVDKSLVIFIAVGTPSRKDGSVDMTYIDEVAGKIGENLNGYKVIATKSTVPVGTGERIRKIIRQYETKDINFDIVSNPEFLREGSAIEDFMRPNRVIIGATSEQAKAIMKDLYSPLYLIEAPCVVTNIETAEMIKYASNAFLATKISFINEIANICERVGADVNVVARGMGLDQRIGSKFLHAGPGYGGSCFPKDTVGIAKIAEKHGYRFEIVHSVMKVNERQKERMVAKVKEAVGNLRGKTIGVLGLSFKPNTDDLREAPSLKIISALQREGAKIRAYDPKAMEAAQKIFKKIEYGKDPYDVAKGVDALLIITEWNQFRNLDLKRLQKIMKMPVFLDFRNIYEPAKMRESGFQYFAVGR